MLLLIMRFALKFRFMTAISIYSSSIQLSFVTTEQTSATEAYVTLECMSTATSRNCPVDSKGNVVSSDDNITVLCTDSSTISTWVAMFPLMHTPLLSALTPPPSSLAKLPLKAVFPVMYTLLLSHALTPPPLTLAELSLKVVFPLMYTPLLSTLTPLHHHH